MIVAGSCLLYLALPAIPVWQEVPPSWIVEVALKFQGTGRSSSLRGYRNHTDLEGNTVMLMPCLYLAVQSPVHRSLSSLSVCRKVHPLYLYPTVSLLLSKAAFTN